MAKLPRVTAKIFASNAAAGDIGQFGSALAGTKVATGDISQIQALSAYTTGWRGAVISDRNYPPLQEMNGLQKTFSQQIAYILESGIPEYDSATTYYQYEFCRVNEIIYYSLIDNNTNNTPASNTDKWAVYNPGSNLYALKDLSNLSSDGNDFINQSKAMITGNVSDNALVYADILSRYHSSYDSTKFTVTGTPTITSDGIASGFSSNNYLSKSGINLNSATTWKIYAKFEKTNNTNPIQALCDFTNGYNSVGIIINDNRLACTAYGADNTQILSTASGNVNIALNTDYWVEFEFTGTNYLGQYSVNGLNYTQFLDVASTTKVITTNLLYIGLQSANVDRFFEGTIDLKYFKVEIDGVTIFSGNKTGSDSYTIGGNTVTIPYTVTSGGAKIADYASLSDIQDVFNAGFTDEQYFTIDEDNQQFTLPQGMSVYEGIGNKANKSLSNINADGINDIFVYNQPADTYTTLTLGASGSTYTATDNGFFVLRAVGSSFRMYMDNGFGAEPSSTAASINVTGVLPVRKGQSITIDYTIMNVVFFIFIKARGV